MSLRQVLTVFNIERQLNSDETALLNALRSWSDTERQMFIDSLSNKPQKKPGKKGVGKGASKSARASSLQQQISGRAQSAIRPPTAATDDNEDDGRCTHKIGEDSGGPIICDTLVDNNVHHKQTDPDYHQFVPPDKAAASSGD